MSITLNRVDLDFLLEQVTINYLKPDPNNPGQFIPTPYFNYSAVANALDPRGLREVAGTNNNLVGGYWDPNTETWVPGPNTNWGAALQPFLNLSPGQSFTSSPNVDYNTVSPIGPTGNPVAVSDTDPRLVSNLVASMYTDPASPLYNPAIAAAATNGDPNAQFGGLQVNGLDVGFVSNAGVLGGGKYNAWFVAFGQFFDHGLDFVNRDTDPNATITVNLSPNDPLYDEANGVTSIKIRRADVANPDDAGNDGIFGTPDDAYYNVAPDGTITTSKPIFINQTGLLIDQSQTYGSHQSVNALIREYEASGAPTGRVVAGDTLAGPALSSGLATWADIKANALRIGVILNDTDDLHNAPVLRVDPAGKLLYTPNPGENYDTSQIVGFNPNTQDPNDPFMRDALGNVLRTGQNLLIDQNPAQSVDAHIITGDGRANENIGLTAVHHVFHEEHNALVENIKTQILATGDAAFIAQWELSPGVWDGEKLYQAARLITESEYNHIAIDQYIGTLYGALPEFVSYSSDINMGVSLEFSQAVFRLGHSMLTQTINVEDPNNPGQPLKLLDMFLNPTLYQQIGPTALAEGLTTTLGNEVDEFVTPALQQTLLGQPLDLATINIARGRDVNLPTWNEFRQQVYDQLIQNTNNTNGSALAPYTNWADVFDHLKNPLTGVNLIAAYGRDTGTTDWGIDEARAAYESGAGTLDDIRQAAQTMYDAYLAGDPAAKEFMKGTPTYDPGTGQWTFTGADQGFWDIDLWIGGLAERPLFDGPLGTTFSYVLLDFAQRQQDGDRFYYLYRLPMGTHLGNEVIENQFGNLVMDHTGLDHLNGEIFIWANATYDLTENPDYFNVADETILDVDGAEIPASGGHVIVNGYGGDDYLVAGLGDDTIYGDAGNDQIYGSQGNDHLFGGEGNDYIFDDENDDFITGGPGDDRIFAGPGAVDTVFGDEGNDEIHGGDGVDELIGNEGDDLIYGDGDTDTMFGSEGNDYMDGGDSVDEMQGQEGDDWLIGGVGDDHLMGGDGNDLLQGGLGPTANDGDRLLGAGDTAFDQAFLPALEDTGFDVASYEEVGVAVTADLETSNENGTGGLLDTYAGVDGLVGSRFNDNLTGAGPDTVSTNGVDNLLVGGAGNDILTGLGGDDRILGDSVVVHSDFTVDDGPYTTIANWRGTGQSRPDFGALIGLGYFLGDNGAAGTADKAVFSGDFADYDITLEPGAWIRLVDTRGIDSTAVGDLVRDVELFEFADGTRTASQLINQAPTDIQWNGVTPALSDLPGTGAIVANLSTVDPDNPSGFTYSLLSQTESPSQTGQFAVSSAGIVTRTGGPMLANSTYTLTVRTTDPGGKFFDETFNIRTNGNGSTNLTAFATVFDDIIYADDGDDTLSGGDGNDTLFGQDENDILNGGPGNDVLNGGDGDADTASYAGAAGPVTVSVAIVGPQNTGGAGVDTLISVGSLIGSSFNDTLTGDGSVNVLTGAGGNDVLNGGGGTDTAVFAAAIASYTFALSSPGVVAVADVVGADGTDTLTSMETVQFGSQTLALRIGTVGVDNLNFNGGDDLLLGFGGNDTLSANGGDDVLIGGGGNDVLDGGSGNNTAVFSGPVADYGFALSGSNLVVTDNVAARDGVDTLNDFNDDLIQFGTNVYGLEYGSNSGQTISGSNASDLLLGFGGNDTLNGSGGNDVLDGGTGGDTLAGGAGADTINTGAANDNVVDIIRFGATADFGDTVNNFDANDTVDRVEFTGSLNSAYDDGNNDNNFTFAVGDGGASTVNATVGQGSSDIEALLLTGVNGEGVLNADLSNAAAVAAAFNAEFNITASNGEDALLVINDTNANSFANWQWAQAAGGGAEVDASELTFISLVNANNTVGTNSFDFV